jgi:hypothetical protein
MENGDHQTIPGTLRADPNSPMADIAHQAFEGRATVSPELREALASLPKLVAVAPTPALPEADADRLDFPMFDGLLAYFPNALAEVSRVSKVGNDQHNPGQPMHWARGKSTDHGNKIVRHLIDAGGIDARGIRHTARLAWRALALLQEELEAAGAPMSRGSRAA